MGIVKVTVFFVLGKRRRELTRKGPTVAAARREAVKAAIEDNRGRVVFGRTYLVKRVVKDRSLGFARWKLVRTRRVLP